MRVAGVRVSERLQRWSLGGFAGLALAVCVAASGIARAEGAKPFRSARLTFLNGEVHVEQPGSTPKTAAVRNMPLVEGAVISTGGDGQAEVEFEDGSLVRLTPSSGLSLLNLSVDSSGTYQTRTALTGGLAYLELRAGTKFHYSLDAGGDVITPVENATVRVNFDEPPAVIAVLDGSVHINEVAGTDVDATAGQTVRMDPAYKGQIYQTKQAIAPETWDRWNEDRDEAAASQAGSQTDARKKFAGDLGYGWSDLDANGSWYDVPGHGQVWQPDVAAQGDALLAADAPSDDDAVAGAAFDPYGYGNWVWSPAGYAWASSYGWGWLPYRCGSWSYWSGFGWGWSPALGCGNYGFGGGYYGVNIGRAPHFYRRPGRPVAGPGGVHPVLRGRGTAVPVAPSHLAGQARMIAGNTVEPLPPIGGGYTVRGGSAIGWGLRRDYPVNRNTHEPAEGLVAAHGASAVSNARVTWMPQVPSDRRASSLGGRRPGDVARPAYVSPSAGTSSGAGRAAVSGSRQGQTYPSGQGQRSAPAQRQTTSAPAPRSAPAPSAPASHASAPASSGPSHGH